VAESIHLPELPKVEVVDGQGKPIDTSTIDNYDGFMAFLMQASIAANTASMKKYYDDRKSKGRILYLPLDITQNRQGNKLPYPCQTLYIENNGPGQIFIAINSPEGRATPVPATRQAYFPFETHVIERFYIWSAAGTVATATAIGKY
jgi:hypothetical protein